MEAILDTTALFAIADGAPRILPALRVVRTIRLPVVVLAEFRWAAQQSTLRDDYDDWLSQLATPDTLLSADAETARRYASLRRELDAAGIALPPHDYWIAALAVQHGLPVVSNQVHFDRVPALQRITW